MPIVVLVPAKYENRSRRSTRIVLARENRGEFHVIRRFRSDFFTTRSYTGRAASAATAAIPTAASATAGAKAPKDFS